MEKWLKRDYLKYCPSLDTALSNLPDVIHESTHFWFHPKNEIVGQSGHASEKGQGSNGWAVWQDSTHRSNASIILYHNPHPTTAF